MWRSLFVIQLVLITLGDLTIYHQGAQTNINGFTFKDESLKSRHGLQLQNVPSKGIRIRICEQGISPFSEELLTVLDFIQIQQRAYRVGDCVGYNFWYESPTLNGEILQKAQRYVRNLAINHTVISSSNIPIRKNDSYSIRINSKQQIKQINVVYEELQKVNKIKQAKYIKNKKQLTINNGKIVQVQTQYTRTLHGNGLHQSVQISLQNNNKISQNCRMIAEEQVTDKYYIDTDQFQSVTRYETIDIQKPNFLNKQFYAKLTLPIQINQTHITTQYPVHFRYQKAGQSQYSKASITPLRSLQITCNNITNYYKQSKQIMLPSTKIPVGLIQDKSIVFIGTLVSTFYAAMLIRKAMKDRE